MVYWGAWKRIETRIASASSNRSEHIPATPPNPLHQPPSTNSPITPLRQSPSPSVASVASNQHLPPYQTVSAANEFSQQKPANLARPLQPPSIPPASASDPAPTANIRRISRPKWRGSTSSPQPLTARLISHADLLAPAELENPTAYSQALRSAVHIKRFRQVLVRLVAFFTVRGHHNHDLHPLLSRRKALALLFWVSHVHHSVYLTRCCSIWCLYDSLRAMSTLSSSVSFSVFAAHLLLYIAFELIMFRLRLILQQIRDDLPHYILGVSAPPTAKLPARKALDLVDEREILRREVQSTVGLVLEEPLVWKGVSGPFNLSSLTAEKLTNCSSSLRGRRLPPDAKVFALSYAEVDNAAKGTMTSATAKAVVNILRQQSPLGPTIPERFYLWSHAGVPNHNEYAQSRLVAYLKYPTIQIERPGKRNTERMRAETDLAMARNALRNGSIKALTRDLVARRRDRHLRREQPAMEKLLARLRAISLGMPPSRGTHGVRCVANAMRLVGTSWRPNALAKKMDGKALHWHGVFEFVDQTTLLHLDRNTDAYLRSVMQHRVKMFALERYNRCCALWIYVDDFGDLILVAAELDATDSGVYRVLRKARIVPSKVNREDLLGLYECEERSASDDQVQTIVKPLLARANINCDSDDNVRVLYPSDYRRMDIPQATVIALR